MKLCRGIESKRFSSPAQDALEKRQTPIDLLFIDGPHSYEASKSDLTGWGIWVKSSAWVIMHDSGPEGWPGPIRVVQEILNTGQWVNVESTTTACVLRKNDLYKGKLLKLGC